jgi:uncharacterized membrane protein YfcA
LIEYWWAYPLLGTLTGLLAGLLGVGGGLIMVPVLVMIFEACGFPPLHLMHLALATSMATIMLTSLSSMRSHHRHGSVRWDIVRALTPGLIVGTFLGALCAQFLHTYWLILFFVVFVYYSGVRMLFGAPPQPHHQLPGKAGLLGAGAFIGVVSSWVAIGGASLAVPFMVRRNVAVHQGIGTSAAIGFPVAVAGTVGYIVSGWGYALPPHSFGFVYLPAWLGLVATTVLMAPLGVRLAHRLPAALLRQLFACLLLAIATRMLFRLF